jgi:hypothetical protein
MKILLRNRLLRRFVGGLCVVAGGLLMWLAPNAVVVGIVLFAAGVALEIAGIALEHRESGP